jgi:prepilin-type N-terminal cleavage/methylation domain-containing protein
MRARNVGAHDGTRTPARGPRARGARRGAGRRRAFTLIEVIVALSLLVSVLTAMGVFAVQYAHAVSESHSRSTASDLATDKLEEVKGAARYTAIDAFAGTETSITDYPKFQRTTIVQHVGGGPADFDDYKVITVEVTGPALETPVTETTVISSF